MQGFLNFAVLVVMFVVGVIAVNLVPGWLAKVVVAVTAVLLAGCILVILPSGVERKVEAVAPSASPTYPGSSSGQSQSDSKTVVLENYRAKGDSIALKCSGATGNITCKPAK